jgi:hypothetical protein
MLRFLPPAQHDSLVLVTDNRTEIAVQTLLRVDEDFVAAKGRLAATQDAGRVYFIPYANINYVGFQREVKDAEFFEMFAGFDAPPGPATPPPAEAAAPPSPSAGPMEGRPAPADPSSAQAPGKTPRPLKSAVLERFRARNSNPGVVYRPPDAPVASE